MNFFSARLLERSVDGSLRPMTLLLLALVLGACGAEGTTQVPERVVAPRVAPVLDQTVRVGQSATFNESASGTAPLSYQWQKNGTDIEGATGASYTTPPTVAADSGSTFIVVVSNSAGKAATTPANLIVTAPVTLTITQSPAPVTVASGTTATFHAAATCSAAAITWQWQRSSDGGTTFTNITSATVATYVLVTATSDNGAVFRAQSSCGGSTQSSDTATLTVTAAPSATGTALITISVPQAAAASAAHRSKALKIKQSVSSYVSSKTLSLSVAVTAVDGTPPATPIQVIVYVGSNSACTASAGSISCAVAIAAPVGNNSLHVATYAQAGGLGFAISEGDAIAAIAAGATVEVPINLLAVVAASTITLSPSTLTLGTPGTFTATIIGKDITGDVIGGTDPYYAPITVITDDIGGHVIASPALPATLTSPAENTLTFTYDGLGAAATYSFTVFGPTSYPIVVQLESTLEHLYVALSTAVNVYDIQADGTITGPSRTISEQQRCSPMAKASPSIPRARFMWSIPRPRARRAGLLRYTRLAPAGT